MPGSSIPPYVAHFDSNGVPTMLGVVGTQGTSDTAGTANVLPIAINPLTGAAYVEDLSTGGANPTAGTLDLLKAGTITSIQGGTLNAGTITTGSLSNIATLGTIQNLNTGTLAVVAAGSHVHTAGTLTTGTLQNLVSGSVVQTAGTLTTMIAGTLTALANGTITAGTIRQQWQPVNQVTSFGTLGTASGSLFATISGTSGAGTKHMISGISIVEESGTADVRVLIGSAIVGGSVLAAGKFVPSAGIVRDFNPPIESGTNSELIYHFVGAGTAYITCQYWKSIL